MDPWESFARQYMATRGTQAIEPTDPYETRALTAIAGQGQPPQETGGGILGQAWPNPVDPATAPTGRGLNLDHITNFAKGIIGTTGLISPSDKTEANYSRGVVDTLRGVAQNADVSDLAKGKFSGVDYSHYPNVTRSGQEFPVKGVVIDPAVREQAGLSGGLGMALAGVNDPTLSTALSLGAGSLFVRDGDVYFSDLYDYSKNSANKGNDGYSKLRQFAGDVVGKGGEFGSVIKLGSAKDMYNQDLPDTENLPSHIVRRFEQQEAEGLDPSAPTTQYQDLINAAPTMQRALRDSPVIEVGGNKGTGADVTQGMVAGDNSYTIQKGDTLGKIAKQLGTTVTALQKLNGIENAGKIRAGSKLKY